MLEKDTSRNNNNDLESRSSLHDVSALQQSLEYVVTLVCLFGRAVRPEK